MNILAHFAVSIAIVLGLQILAGSADLCAMTWAFGAAWAAFRLVERRRERPGRPAARLLAADANTSVRFVPDADVNGTVTDGITFHAWDQTSGSAGSSGSAGTSGEGGSTGGSAGSGGVAPDCDAPLDEVTIQNLSMLPLMTHVIELQPGNEYDFTFYLMECCYFQTPVQTCTEWSVPPGSGADIDPETGHLYVNPTTNGAWRSRTAIRE